MCSSFVLGLCCERGVGVALLTEQGRFMARVTGPVSGNVLLRRKQYRVADNVSSALPVVRAIVFANIDNSQLVLLRGTRDAHDPERQALLRAEAHYLAQMGAAAALPRGAWIETSSVKQSVNQTVAVLLRTLAECQLHGSAISG